MPTQDKAFAQPGIDLSPNAIVTILCVGMTFFMLLVASVCGPLMRSDAAMMAVARPKICLMPAKQALAVHPSRSAGGR